MTSDYKKYSLEKLQEWVHDAMNSDASPHEIYSAIREAVREDYYYHKDCISRAGEFLELLNSNSKSHIKKWDAWEEHYYPEEYQYTATGEKFPIQYTEEELNAMCDKAVSDEEKEKCREYNVREAEYYSKRTKLDAEVEAIRKAGGYEWTPEVKQDKTKKWVLPVEEIRDEDTGEDEYCVSFPDDLLEAANLKEGDQVEWVDQGDGSYLIKKVPMTYNDMIAAGWTMTADGFWIKE